MLTRDEAELLLQKHFRTENLAKDANFISPISIQQTLF